MKKILRDQEVAKEVYRLSGIGVPQDQIAIKIGMSRKTMTNIYRDELDRGMAEANESICDRLFKIATKGDDKVSLTACIFWVKSRMGWKETNIEEVRDFAKEDESVRRLLARIRETEFTSEQDNISNTSKVVLEGESKAED